MSDFFDLFCEFEVKKRTVKLNDEKVTISIPPSLLELYAKKQKKSMTEAVSSLGLTDVSIKKGKLIICSSVFRPWFEKPIQETVCHIVEIMDKPELRNVDIVMLVGGFAECSLLQDAIRSALRRKEVLIPEDAGIAVLKGAVEFGLKADIFTRRLMKSSYGIAKCIPFNQSVHDRSKVETDAQGSSVVQVFDAFVTKHSEVDVGQAVTKAVIPTETMETKIEIYTSQKADTKYISEESCKMVGEIKVEHPDGKTPYDKMFKVQLEFGETEIIVTIQRNVDAKVFRSKINFL